MIVDDYILLFTSLAGILWGMVRYLLAFRAPEAGVSGERRLSFIWAIQSVLIFVIGAAVIIVTARLGTENRASDVFSLGAAALYAIFALFLPRKGDKPGLALLDRAILLVLAVLLLTGSLYDNLAR